MFDRGTRLITADIRSFANRQSLIIHSWWWNDVLFGENLLKQVQLPFLSDPWQYLYEPWMLQSTRDVSYSVLCITFVFNLTRWQHIHKETWFALPCLRCVVLVQFALRVWRLWHRVSSETTELLRKFTSCIAVSALRRNQISWHLLLGRISS